MHVHFSFLCVIYSGPASINLFYNLVHNKIPQLSVLLHVLYHQVIFSPAMLLLSYGVLVGKLKSTLKRPSTDKQKQKGNYSYVNFFHFLRIVRVGHTVYKLKFLDAM